MKEIFYLADITTDGIDELKKQYAEITGTTVTYLPYSNFMDEIEKLEREAGENYMILEQTGKNYDAECEISHFKTLSKNPETIRLSLSFFNFS